MHLENSPEVASILVSDFDGTMTQHDFYRLAVNSLIPATCPNYWAEFRSGRLTHFEALRNYFLAIDAREDQVLDIVGKMELDPALRQSVEALRAANWDIVVTSAGCDWYIQHLLRQAGVKLEVHANPGKFQLGHGLQMELPTSSPFLSYSIGIDKQSVVQKWLATGVRVAFAGDGFPDVEAARLVADELRFARGDLAHSLSELGLEYHHFEVWSDIAQRLLNQD